MLEDGPWLGFGVEDILAAPGSRNSGDAVQYVQGCMCRDAAQDLLWGPSKWHSPTATRSDRSQLILTQFSNTNHFPSTSHVGCVLFMPENLSALSCYDSCRTVQWIKSSALGVGRRRAAAWYGNIGDVVQAPGGEQGREWRCWSCAVSQIHNYLSMTVFQAGTTVAD